MYHAVESLPYSDHELHTGVWASESIGEAPVKGERMVSQMLKNTRFGKLPHEILWRGLQALQYQAAIVGIAQNEHTVFFQSSSGVDRCKNY